jgi:hypothetical protein
LDPIHECRATTGRLDRPAAGQPANTATEGKRQWTHPRRHEPHNPRSGLKTLLRERLGAELDTLRETNTRVIAEGDAAVEERNVLINRLSATEDDLAAMRRSPRPIDPQPNESAT